MAISEERRAELARKGAVSMTVQEWLGLDDAEMQVVELRVRLAREVRRRREAAGLRQEELAGRIGVSQPRVVSIESAASVSLDAVILAFFATDGGLAELAEVVGGIPAE